MKKFALYFLPLFAFSVITVISCSPKVDDPYDILDANCEKKWVVNKYDSSAFFDLQHEHEWLSIQLSEAVEDTAIEMYQENFSGNFTAMLDFENWSHLASGNGYVAMMMYDPVILDTILDTTVVACILTKNKIQAVVETIDTATVNVTGPKGRFVIRKQGSTVVAQVIMGTDTVTNTQTNYTGYPPRFAIRMGTKSGLLNDVIGIKLSEFTVISSGGNGPKSDAFKCNSLVFQ